MVGTNCDVSSCSFGSDFIFCCVVVYWSMTDGYSRKSLRGRNTVKMETNESFHEIRLVKFGSRGSFFLLRMECGSWRLSLISPSNRGKNITETF